MRTSDGRCLRNCTAPGNTHGHHSPLVDLRDYPFRCTWPVSAQGLLVFMPTSNNARIPRVGAPSPRRRAQAPLLTALIPNPPPLVRLSRSENTWDQRTSVPQGPRRPVEIPAISALANVSCNRVPAISHRPLPPGRPFCTLRTNFDPPSVHALLPDHRVSPLDGSMIHALQSDSWFDDLNLDTGSNAPVNSDVTQSHLGR